MTPHTPAPMRVTIAANNGDIGGGEVMLLNIAHACEELGVDVTVVGPSQPSGLVDAARAAGHRTVVLEARGRKEWMRALRRWDRGRDGVLWCNGMVPALATAGHRNRIVHVHSTVSRARQPLLALTRFGALTTLVPSHSMLHDVRGAAVLPNWVAAAPPRTRAKRDDDAFVVGFLGRLSVDKGVPVLAGAMSQLSASHPGRFRLFLAGDPRFVSDESRQAMEAALAPITELVDRVGWVERDDVFSRIDLLVCPSVWPEPFGLSAAEAMAARMPLLVSDAGALPEVVGVGSPSIVPAGDAAALATAILQRADGSIDTTTSVEAGYARWEAEFSPDAGRERVRQLLARLEG